MSGTESTDILIVGGGPAGMMAGLLFARAGLTVKVLEKHGDFLRDFRGDTVHPSTMQILHELGMLQRFLARPHDRLDGAQIKIAGVDYNVADLSHLPVEAPFIAMMPQWEFLDFLKVEAERFPTFSLQMNCEVTDAIFAGGRASGVVTATGQQHLAKKLVLFCDGRRSLVRTQNLLSVEQLGAPMDVLWFSMPKSGSSDDKLLASVDTGRMVILIDRGSYWQTAFLIPKGAAGKIKERGVEWVLEEVRAAYPNLAFGGGRFPESVDELFLLNVALDRLREWHRPGLLAIGDAAHAMSPIGGIGINLAIQDAVAAANLLAAPLIEGDSVDAALYMVQRRRLFPTRLIQSGQKLVQDQLIGRVIGGRDIRHAPLPVRLLNKFSMLRRIPGRIIGLGFRRESVKSPLRQT